MWKFITCYSDRLTGEAKDELAWGGDIKNTEFKRDSGAPVQHIQMV